MNQPLRRTQALLGMAALGVAGMVLGLDMGHRIDTGSIGGALLYGALWLFVVHLAKFSTEVFADRWSPAEKQAAVGIAFLALISFHVAKLLFFAWKLIASTIRRQDSGAVHREERDLRITHGAARFADGSLALLIIGLVLVLVVLPDQSRTWLRPFIVANVLIALLIARSLVENICTVWRYRCERA
jgi:hypothetical protein